MQLKDRIKEILRKEYAGERPWRAFIYWWLAANGYAYEIHSESINFVDGPSDGGIDVIAWPLENQGRNDVLIIQSKYFGQSPSEKDLERFHGAIAALKGPLDAFHTWLASCRDELHGLYSRLREERRRHRYIVIAPCRFEAGHKRSLKQRGIEVYDIDVLGNLERNYSEGKTPRLDQFRISNASAPRKIAEADGTRVWIFTVPARQLGLAFVRHGNMLFAGNIRYALRGQTAKRVREGILETIRDYSHEMVFSHNGITVTGARIQKRGDAVIMRSATIVNGAQTVSYFGNPRAMKHLTRNSARVIVKFVEVADAEMLNETEVKVALRANNQNKVDSSDFSIEYPSLVSLQRYFRRQDVHLERKKGEQKLRFGQLGIAKERLAQVLAAIESAEGAVGGKSKQKLFSKRALKLFKDYDVSEKTRAEAVAWARVDDSFRTTIYRLGNKKRRKRGQLAELASLTVFHRVLRRIRLKNGFLRAMTRWDTDSQSIERFLEMSCKVVLSALLRCSSQYKKNEPAFYKALQSVKPAIDSAVWRCRRKVRQYYSDYLGN
jgi:hypothetical protein